MIGAVLVAAALWLAAVPAALGEEHVKVGISGGDGEEIWARVREIAKRQGLIVDVVVINDYMLPNAGLNDGDLDANAFQHKPYLEGEVRARGYRIVPLCDTIVEPIGLYSRRFHKLAELPDGATIGIPNNPSNGGRALLLLQQEHLLTLRPGTGILPTVRDITSNPHRLKFTELDSAQLPRSLPDLDAAVINTNYALDAHLNPARDALAIESRTNNPYGNIIAVRAADKDRPVFRKLCAAYQNDEIRQFILKRFDGAILPVF
jgi:D-methionine transport system substrate-binding protein